MLTPDDSQHMLTFMESALEIAEGAASTDPDVGLRAVAALRTLTERLEILQVDNARGLRVVLAGHRYPARRHQADRAPQARQWDREAVMELFGTPEALAILTLALEHSGRLGHRYIGGEHLLLALVSSGQPAGAVLREHGVTPQRVEEEIVRRAGHGAGAGLFGSLDRDALAAMGSISAPCAKGSNPPSNRMPSRTPAGPPGEVPARPG